MAENKFGLHKQVSAIFDGVPLPTQSISCADGLSLKKANCFNHASELTFKNTASSINLNMAKLLNPFLNIKCGIENKKQMIMLLITFVLSLLLFYILFGPGFSKEKKPEVFNLKAELMPQIKWQIPDQLSNIRDPMQIGSASKSKKDSTDVVIKGIVYSEDCPALIINGLILNEGQKISGVKILKIYSDRVELEKDGKTWIQKVQ
ncbi:MAG: hypothetical protein BWY26_00005 [Elusimicrobia bacterium ADurb.Bin231]|nr:MAG: hypothetical protein BWY26_00005 [Elusimicrobia bacterium ADurb.Bin231]